MKQFANRGDLSWGMQPAAPTFADNLINVLWTRITAYLALTKPTLQLLVVLTGAAALVVEGNLTTDPRRFGLVLLGLALAAGSAKALNQYLERKVDAVMERTRRSRPLPRGIISATEALIFAIILGLTSTLLFWVQFNPLAAMLSLGTILFYSFFYTLYLKRRTPYSIIIGGLAGGMGPVIAWAAAAGAFSLVPFLMLALIFLWTPAHFWSLAIQFKEDFRSSGYPVLPLVLGEEKTWKKIFFYAVLTILASLTLPMAGMGVFYLASAVILGGWFIAEIMRARKATSRGAARKVFVCSIIYLVALFVAIILDAMI